MSCNGKRFYKFRCGRALARASFKTFSVSQEPVILAVGLAQVGVLIASISRGVWALVPLYRPSDQPGTWWKVKVKLHVAATVQTEVSGSLECVPGHSLDLPFCCDGLLPGEEREGVNTAHRSKTPTSWVCSRSVPDSDSRK